MNCHVKCETNVRRVIIYKVQSILRKLVVTSTWLLFVSCYYLLFIISDIDDCESVTCQNSGSCVDSVNDYSCDCVSGYTGEHCETGRVLAFSHGYMTY